MWRNPKYSIAFVTSKILKSDCAQQPIFIESLANMPSYQALLWKSYRTVTTAYYSVADELARERHPCRGGSVNARQNLKRLTRLHPQPIYYNYANFIELVRDTGLT